MSNKRTNRVEVVADICLYGNRETGAGWLAQSKGGAMLGDGTPSAGRSFTEAVWGAVGALNAAGVKEGQVRVFAPGGERMSIVPLSNVPIFGAMKWEPAVQYVITI